MSYEGDMLVKLAMPAKQDVENAIITTLFNIMGVSGNSPPVKR
jgi:hypothetical protein